MTMSNKLSATSEQPQTMLYRMPEELRYIIPAKFLFGRQELNKNQRKIVALLLLQIKQWRDELYESDLINGKMSVTELSVDERRAHYNNFRPDPDTLPKHHLAVRFQQDIIKKMFGSIDYETHRIIGRALKGIMGRVVHEQDRDAAGKLVTKMYVIIPKAEISGGVLEILIDRDAAIKLIDHSKGYSDTDLSIWTELDGGYSQKLLEVISKNKRHVNGMTMSIEDFRFTFACDYKTYSRKDVEDAIKRGDNSVRYGDHVLKYNPKTEIFEKVPLYPRMQSLQHRVIEPAFQQLLSKSQGYWVATDKPEAEGAEPKGYELIRVKKKITGIRFCLKYVKNPVVKAIKEKKPEVKDESIPLLETMSPVMNSLAQTIIEVNKVSAILDVTQEQVNTWKLAIDSYITTRKLIESMTDKPQPFFSNDVDEAIEKFYKYFKK
ncbi:replication initiation protein [Photobacterium aquimaris]|uniref:Replication initiation protein n=2 Tax=Photobacterium aquimaris TaxID=512643 RepID=A0A2T3I0N4_9GAMM|nr:replication initiation protein [Photobacterium aquimaris]